MESRKLKRVVIREEFFALTNDTFESIILGQLLYWQDKLADFDKFILEEKERRAKEGKDLDFKLTKGWMYKSAKELADECMLTISEVTIRRYLQSLIKKKLIEKRNNPDNKWDKTLQYRVNLDYIITELKKLGYDGLSGYKHQNELSKLQNEASEQQNEAAIPIDYNKDYNKKETISLNNKDIEKKYSEKFSDEQSLQFAAEPSPLGTEEKEEKNSVKRKENEADEKTWRDNFDIFLRYVYEARDKLLKDDMYRAQIAKYYPNADYDKTINAEVDLYWGTDAAWEKRKKSRTKSLDMVKTLKNNFKRNIIYKPRSFSKQEQDNDQVYHSKKRDAGSVYHDYAGYGTERYRRFIKWLSDNATYIYEHYTYLITLNQFTEMVKVEGIAESMSEIILALAANPTEYGKYDNLYEYVKEKLHEQR